MPTFDVRVAGDRVLVDPTPNPPGTRVEPARCGTSSAQRAIEFYIGYLSRAPLRLAADYRRALPYLSGALVLTAFLVALLQGPFAPSTFEFGNYRRFEGTIVEAPHPMLSVARPGLIDGPHDSSRYLLTVKA